MKFTGKELNEAATAHAKTVLGDQFKTNRDAVQSIKTDWKAGATFVQKKLIQKGKL